MGLAGSLSPAKTEKKANDRGVHPHQGDFHLGLGESLGAPQARQGEREIRDEVERPGSIPTSGYNFQSLGKAGA